MPYQIRKLPNRNCFRVRNPENGRVYSECTSLEKAKAQVKLLRAIDHGFKPRSRSRSSVKKISSTRSRSSTRSNK